MFLALEGLDGSGKSTIADYLAVKYNALVVREPGSTPVGEALRQVMLGYKSDELEPMTNLLTFSAARAEVVEKVIKPSLEAGAFVVADRFVGSSLAYQGHGNGIPIHVVTDICNYSTGNLWPDKTILFDISLKTSKARSSKKDVRDHESDAYMRRVSYGYTLLSEFYEWDVVLAEYPLKHVIAQVEDILWR